MDKDYLIQFNTDGTRLNTYANGVHYSYTPAHEEYETVFEDGEQKEVYTGFVDEEILNLVDGFDYQTVIDNGGVWFDTNDYNKLVGNADKEYIYKDGEIVEKPAYVPTKEEKALEQINQIMAENNTQIADIKDAMLVAVLTDDTELQSELKKEYASVIEDTNNKLQEVKAND